MQIRGMVCGRFLSHGLSTLTKTHIDKARACWVYSGELKITGMGERARLVDHGTTKTRRCRGDGVQDVLVEKVHGEKEGGADRQRKVRTNIQGGGGAFTCDEDKSINMTNAPTRSKPRRVISNVKGRADMANYKPLPAPVCAFR